MTKQEFETCVEEYSKDIYSFCKHLTCSLQEAEDLYQNTFLKLISGTTRKAICFPLRSVSGKTRNGNLHGENALRICIL